MAFAVALEKWFPFDHFAAADILQNVASGSIGGMVAGLRGEGQAISAPVNLRLGNPGAEQGEIIVHVAARYDADGIPLRIRNSTNSGPYVEVIASSITVHQSNGTLIGTSSITWPAGAVRTLSLAVTMATTATGRVKLWIGTSVGLDLSSIVTVPSGGSSTAKDAELDGFGLFDDVGQILGSGGWVDADVPLHKWCRTRHATAPGTSQNWTPTGSGSTHVDRVNETLANGDTNSSDYSGGVDGTAEGFFCDVLPGDVGSIWGVQHEVQARQVDGSLIRSLRLQTHDTGGVHSATGTNAMTLAYTMPHKFYRTNPGATPAWSTTYATTQFECTLTA